MATATTATTTQARPSEAVPRAAARGRTSAVSPATDPVGADRRPGATPPPSATPPRRPPAPARPPAARAEGDGRPAATTNQSRPESDPRSVDVVATDQAVGQRAGESDRAAWPRRRIGPAPTAGAGRRPPGSGHRRSRASEPPDTGGSTATSSSSPTASLAVGPARRCATPGPCPAPRRTRRRSARPASSSTSPTVAPGMVSRPVPAASRAAANSRMVATARGYRPARRCRRLAQLAPTCRAARAGSVVVTRLRLPVRARMTRMLLVRHGQSEWNALGRWQGQADPPLSALGREQARSAVARLGAVDLIVASDLDRALTTAAIMAEGLGVGPVMVEPRLRERSAGEWSGLTRAEIDEQWPGYLDRAPPTPRLRARRRASLPGPRRPRRRGPRPSGGRGAGRQPRRGGLRARGGGRPALRPSAQPGRALGRSPGRPPAPGRSDRVGRRRRSRRFGCGPTGSRPSGHPADTDDERI